MRRAALSAVLVAVASATVQAGVEVQAQDGRVAVRATAAPVSEILDRLSRQTGMKVVYEGTPPRQLVTAAIENRTPAEAVLAILEGLGLNYALVLDPAGTRVDTLLMAGAGGSSAASASSLPPASAPQPARARVPQPPPQFEPEPEPEAEPDEEPVEGEEGGEDRPLPGGVPELRDGAQEKPQPTTPQAPLFPPPANYPSSPFAPQPFFPGTPTPGQQPQQQQQGTPQTPQQGPDQQTDK